VNTKPPPPPSKTQTTTYKRAACGLAVPPYQRAKHIYLPSNATDAGRGRSPAFFETLARPSTLRASRLRICSCMRHVPCIGNGQGDMRSCLLLRMCHLLVMYNRNHPCLVSSHFSVLVERLVSVVVKWVVKDQQVGPFCSSFVYVLDQQYTPKSAGSALVIGKIVLIMPVAAAKINKTSMVPAFDQTNVQRITQVSSGAANLYAPFLQYKQCFLFLFSIPPEFLKILSTGRLWVAHAAFRATSSLWVVRSLQTY